MTTLPLSELLGATVFDRSGAPTGRVREVTLAPQEDRTRIASLIVKTKSGNRVLPFSAIASIDANIHTSTNPSDWPVANGAEGLFLLERDLLDQQVIDVHGRKVVRVNDVELQIDSVTESGHSHTTLRVTSVDIGARGAVRRLLRGLAPRAALNVLLQKIPLRAIPWTFVDLIETDPARRIKLKISHEGLATLHPADIADIVEDLAPDEREAVFRTLDEDVAAETLQSVAREVEQQPVEPGDKPVAVGHDGVLLLVDPAPRVREERVVGESGDVSGRLDEPAHGLDHAQGRVEDRAVETVARARHEVDERIEERALLALVHVLAPSSGAPKRLWSTGGRCIRIATA